MKKILYSLLFSVISISLYAQNETSKLEEFQAILNRAKQASQETFLKQQNELVTREIFHNLSDSTHAATPQYFSATNLASPTNKSTSPKWQIAMFLDAEQRPTQETLNELRNQIIAGNLQQASVISFGKYNEKKNGKPAGKKCGKEKNKGTASSGPARLYFLYQKQGTPVTETMSINAASEIEPLLAKLFQHFKTSGKLYTGFIVDTHGGGASMWYGQDKVLWTHSITDKLSELKLQVDVLDLQTCHLGSLYSVYPMAQSRMVQYAIVSSDYNIGSTQFMNYRLLKNLHHEPKIAAKTASLEVGHLLNPALTTNSLVIHIPTLGNKIEKWLSSYAAINNESLEQNLDTRVLPADQWKSVQRVITMQSDFAKKQTNTDATGVNNFIKYGQQLSAALSQSIVSQWCYSSKTDQTYYQHIPDNVGCINGVSTNQDHMHILLEDAE